MHQLAIPGSGNAYASWKSSGEAKKPLGAGAVCTYSVGTIGHDHLWNA